MGNIETKLKLNVIQDKKKAQDLLQIAEKQDFYLEECADSKSNSIARQDLNYSANSISLLDVNSFNSFINNVRLPQKLQLELGEINVVHLMPTADGGMPHTRPNMICYPNISFSESTLIHELWHIHQRNFYSYWEQIFKILGWTLWNGTLPTKFEENRRYNPDTIDCPLWIFKDTWIPVPIFKDIMAPTMNMVSIWFYNPTKGYHLTRIPEDVSAYFSNLDEVAFEHPREITAYMLAEPKKFESSPAYKDLIQAIGNTAIL